MWWEVESGMGWWMLWEGALFVLFWAAVIGLVVWGAAAWRLREVLRERTPLDIATERYARGEIAREEFERLRRDLEQAA